MSRVNCAISYLSHPAPPKSRADADNGGIETDNHDTRTTTAHLRVIDKGTSWMLAVTKPCRRIGALPGDIVKVTITLEGDNDAD